VIIHLPIILIILIAIRENLPKRAYYFAFFLGLFLDLVLFGIRKSTGVIGGIVFNCYASGFCL
jgi:hypothetical protein